MIMQSHPTAYPVLLPMGGIDTTNVLPAAVGSLMWLEQVLVEMSSKAEELEEQIAEEATKISFYNRVAETGHLFDMSETAKIFGTGRTKLLKYLRKFRVLMSSRNRFNQPYQKHIKSGVLEYKLVSYRNRITGEMDVKSMSFFTGRGLAWLQVFIEKHGSRGLS